MADKILLQHNIEPYNKLIGAFKEKNRACAIQPTGTGKMYLAIKWLDENPNEPFVYIAPTNVILNSFVDKLTEIYFPNQAENIKKLSTKAQVEFLEKNLNFNLKLMTYAKVNMLTDEQMQQISADKIVLDEFHHLGADKWGASVERFLDIHSDAQVLGLSATPIRASDGKDMIKYLFNGEIDSEITLQECFEKEILQKPKLINGIYSFDEEIISIEDSLKNKDFASEKRKEIEEKLKQAKNLIGKAQHGIRDIFEENLKHFEHENGKLDIKLIVFCNSIEDRHRKMDECKTWFKHGTKIKKYSVTSEENKETINKVVKNFEKDNAKCVKLMFVVDMLNEGLHIKGVDGVVMLRSTQSHIVFTQQLGRALSISNGKEKSPLVFDLVNNIEVLDNDIEEVQKTGLTFIRGVNFLKDEIEDSPFKIQAEIIDIIGYLKSITRDFNDRIAPLVEYYKQHGTIGDITIHNGGEIGGLINKLRGLKRNGKLTLIQIQTLENMGMVWDYKQQPIRPGVKKFTKELLEFMKKNGNNIPKYNIGDSQESKEENKLYLKWLRYTNPKNLSKEEIEYLKVNGIELKRINNLSNVRLELQNFVQEYLKLTREKVKIKKYKATKEELSFYAKWRRYTNPENLSKEEIEYLTINGISIRVVNKRENKIKNVRLALQDFVKEYLAFVEKNNRKPQNTTFSQEERRLYNKWWFYSNHKNLKSKEEIEYLQKNGIDIRVISERENTISDVRIVLQDFVKDYHAFLNSHNGNEPKDNDKNKPEKRLYAKWLIYADPTKSSEAEIKYLRANGIRIKRVAELENIRLEVQKFVEEYCSYVREYKREPKRQEDDKIQNRLYAKWRRWADIKKLNEVEIKYLQENGIKIRGEEKTDDTTENVKDE